MGAGQPMRYWRNRLAHLLAMQEGASSSLACRSTPHTEALPHISPAYRTYARRYERQDAVFDSRAGDQQKRRAMGL